MKGKHTVNIPGELASVASNGIVASADGIYDYNQGKFQEDINNETEGRLDGQDAKLNKKLAEIDQKYDEFEDKTDEYFKEESAKNSQKIDDAVKEIAKIPNNEVKVVDQLPDTGVANTVYRVIGETSYAEWAYTDGQWKKLAENNFGVDDEPTAGSDKLVSSGGVFSALYDRQILDYTCPRRMEDVEKIESSFEDNYVFDSSVSGFETSDYIELTNKEKQSYYICSNNIAKEFFAVKFYNSNKVEISGIAGNLITTNKLAELNIPFNAKYIRYVRVKNTPVQGLYKGDSKTFSDILSGYSNVSIEDTVNAFIGEKEVLDSIDTSQPAFIESNGTVIEGSSGFYVKKYDISTIEHIILKSSVKNDVVYAYSFQDENGEVLDVANVSTLYKQEFVVNVPQNAKYLYVSNPEDVYFIHGGVILKDLYGQTIKETIKEQEIIPSYFIHKGNLNDGSKSWNVYKYNIYGLGGILKLYSNAVSHADVYAFTIQDNNGKAIVFAEENIQEKRYYEIDLDTLENAYFLYVTDPSYVYIDKKEGVVEELKKDIKRIDSTIKSFDNKNQIFTTNNNILWLGTSIPEGATYPIEASKKCGYNCINKSLGGSQLCWTGIRPSNVTDSSGRCLTAKVDELESMFREDVVSGKISENTLNIWKERSYEKSVIPYINGTNNTQVSMIVIDHAFNDRVNINEMLKNEDSIDWASRDRSNFVGAFNYLLDRIREINPFIKIVICGYFQDKYEPYYSAQVCQMQEKVAKKFNISIMKTWEHSQINELHIKGTSNYISEFNYKYGTSYNKTNPDKEGNIMSLQLYCPDMVHPHSDKTGKCNERLNAVVSKLLKDFI